MESVFIQSSNIKNLNQLAIILFVAGCGIRVVIGG
jgi:hypothetical protein